MRKKLCCLLLAVCLVCTGCSQLQAGQDKPPVEEPPAGQGSESIVQPPAEKEPSSTMDPVLETYLENANALEGHSREYGDSVSHIQMETDFVARILYPVGGLALLDTAVENWVRQTAADYQAESVGSGTDGDSAELTVDYNSYLIHETWVSVKLNGIYDRPYLAHPVDVSASFNAERESGRILTLEEVLLPGGEDALRTKVAAQAGIEAELVDENILNHWLLTPEGIEITLLRGEYLPMSSGTVTLMYPYEELEGIFAAPGSTQETPAQGEETQQPQLPERGPDTQPEAPDPTKPMLALTFDDGPSAYTEQLLDAFAAHGGKATFYVVGNMLDARPDTLRRMAAEGHEIGGHSWNHRRLTKLGEEELFDQLMNPRAKIYEITGYDAKTVRLPYGSCNKQIRAAAKELGITLVNWSVDTQDWKLRNADAVYDVVMNKAEDGAIILCHDLHKTTVEAMERAIPALIDAGYQLVTVSELLTSNGGTMNAGTVYFKR